MNRRLACLERTARSKSASGLEATGKPRPAVFGRYETAVEEFRAAIETAKAENPGSSRVSNTPELIDANDEMLRARGELRAFARERVISNERRDGES